MGWEDGFLGWDFGNVEILGWEGLDFGLEGLGLWVGKVAKIWILGWFFGLGFWEGWNVGLGRLGLWVGRLRRFGFWVGFVG